MSWQDLVGVVSPDVLDAALQTSERLRQLDIPHAIIGGIAVGVLGYPRATRDVDFLVGREAEDPDHPRGFSAPVDALYQQDVVDFLLVRHREPDQGVLLDALAHVRAVPGELPIIGARELVWLKLDTPRVRRQHDLNDLRQLLRVGAINAADLLEWLWLLDPRKAEDFEELVNEVL